ncbi:metal-dependent hydrolase family protein [Nigerium massiliense]|uniref:metal-dependent hydrolase family protein n=1 Tax=Nigerium massiliense TaxID=1522317 RepID=UPI001C472C22|nr:amidohydrolase family protein [Nigerium massiliense]
MIDASGYTILPGFIDVHTHLGAGLEGGLDPNAAFASEKVMAVARNARLTLMAGVTTVRDLGGLDYGFARNVFERGDVAAPRTHTAITILSPTGGHADFHLRNGNPVSTVDFPEIEGGNLIDSDDQTRKAIHVLIRSGADCVKVATTGGVSSPSDTPDDVGITAHQLELMREELSKRGGRPIAAHAQGIDGIWQAIEGGVDSVEHGYGITDEAVDALLEKDIWLVPTLASALRVPDPAKVPAYLYEKKVKWSSLARENITNAIKRGVRVAAGTDAAIVPHGLNLREIGHLVELGMEPMQAIVSGTKNGATLMGLDEHLGTLEEGKLADLVAVKFNPLDPNETKKLGLLDNVRVVMQGGLVHKDLDHAFGDLYLPPLVAQTFAQPE